MILCFSHLLKKASNAGTWVAHHLLENLETHLIMDIIAETFRGVQRTVTLRFQRHRTWTCMVKYAKRVFQSLLCAVHLSAR